MELAKAYVQIVPSAEGISGSISNVLDGEANSAGKSAGESIGKSLLGALGKVVTVAAVGKIIKDAVSAGADFEQLVGGVETLFGAGGRSVEEYAQKVNMSVEEAQESYDKLMSAQNKVLENANKAYKTAGVSANDYMEIATSSAAALVSSLGGDTEEAARLVDVAVVDMADNANKMGSDLTAIQNAYSGFAKGNFTMLDNLKLGYGGNQTEMQRLLDTAKRLKAAQGEYVEYSIDSYADIVQAIHVVQEEMGITGTTIEEGAKTVSGSLSMFKASWENFLTAAASGENIWGQDGAVWGLIDSLQAFVGNLVPMISEVLSNLPGMVLYAIGSMTSAVHQKFPEMLDAGVGLVRSMITGIMEDLPFTIAQIFSLVGKIAETIINYDWLSVARDLITTFRDSINVFTTEYFGTDFIVSDMVASILMGLPELITTAGDTMLAFIDGLLAKIPSVINSATEIISTLVTTVLANLPQVISAAGEVMSKFVSILLSRLPDIMSSAVKMIVTLTQGIADKLPAIAESAVTVMKKLVSTLMSKLPDILSTGIKLILELAAGILRSLPDIVKAALTIAGGILDVIHDTDWGSLGQAIISGIINGLRSMAGALWDVMVEIASSAFSAVKSFFGIGSPSKLMRDEIGRWIPVGIAEGIEDNLGSLRGAMSDMAEDATLSYNADLAMATPKASDQQTSQINYGGVTINVTAQDVQQSRAFVDWLEGQLAQRVQSREVGAIA